MDGSNGKQLDLKQRKTNDDHKRNQDGTIDYETSCGGNSEGESSD